MSISANKNKMKYLILVLIETIVSLSFVTVIPYQTAAQPLFSQLPGSASITALAVDPTTNMVYVANADSKTVSVR